MTVYYEDDAVTLHHGDCIEVMRSMPESSVDAVVTDPPYGIGFMGKAWDATFISDTIAKRRSYPGDPSPKSGENGGYRSAAAEAGRYDLSLSGNHAFGAWCQQWAREALRVLKPGGHLLAFGGTRTWHRLACAVEDAGFEVRDSIAWLYGSGFPKSHNLTDSNGDRTGWGTALKPAHEPVVVARKPLIGTVVANVLAHGTGALNVDGCRIGMSDEDRAVVDSRSGAGSGGEGWGTVGIHEEGRRFTSAPAGRWPANVVLDEHQAAALDEQSGETASSSRVGMRSGKDVGVLGAFSGQDEVEMGHDDVGGASRFFYVAKADRNERPKVGGVAHPTVKPLDLMRWLVRLVTPPGGTVLDPFAGSGTTVEACIVEGFRCIAIEKGDEYLPLIESRITRRRDPVRHVELTGDDPGLFDLLGGEAS